VEVVDGETLAPAERVTDRAVAVLAVRMGRTRLIDNLPFAEMPTDAPAGAGT
jgi:pantothenate synthetase